MRKILKKALSILLCATLICSVIIPSQKAYGAVDKKESATTLAEVLTPINNDYRSRTETIYQNINGNDVTVYGFFRDYAESGNNPNFSQALMIYQCIKYKDLNPEKDVYITIQSFHFSVALAACVDYTKEDYGHTKNLYGEDYNSDGYYRLSYLLVEAAKKGIEVSVIGQTDAAGVTQNGVLTGDYSFAQYFESHLDDDTYISGKKVSDYMKFAVCKWTSYGDKSAADMMHNKLCTVSNYVDNSGVEHGAAIWTGSINLDGVNSLEQNGNDSIQTAVVITEHEDMRKVIYNYVQLLLKYCEQEDVVPFRVISSQRTTEQIALITEGRAAEIPEGEQIVYLGSESDKVFELYFTPFGGSFSTWDPINNPYVKYLAEMLSAAKSEDYLEFIWCNPKYNQTFELADIITEVISYAFETNNNKQSTLHLQLPGINASCFDNLIAGENIGRKDINASPRFYHIKDIQLSYVKNGVRQYITILNSLNFHEGSMYHQTNTVLIIKETAETGNGFYVEYGSMICPAIDFFSKRIK